MNNEFICTYVFLRRNKPAILGLWNFCNPYNMARHGEDIEIPDEATLQTFCNVMHEFLHMCESELEEQSFIQCPKCEHICFDAYTHLAHIYQNHIDFSKEDSEDNLAKDQATQTEEIQIESDIEDFDDLVMAVNEKEFLLEENEMLGRRVERLEFEAVWKF